MSQTFSFTVRVVDADGRVATRPDSITVNNALTTGTVGLTSRTIVSRAETAMGTPRTIEGAFTLSPDLSLTTSDGQATTWGSGVDPAGFEVRFTPNAGATFTGSATSVWLSLASARTWTEQLAADGSATTTQVTTGLLEIRPTAGAAQASATITFDQRVDVVAPAVRLTDRTTLAQFFLLGDSQQATTQGTYWFRSDGQFVIYHSVGMSSAISPPETIVVPNEWGPGLLASNFEIRLTPLENAAILSASAPWSTWSNLALGVTVGSTAVAPGAGIHLATSLFRAEIRPVGGTVVASAVFRTNHETEWNPSGAIN